jgi:hypothetical protein
MRHPTGSNTTPTATLDFALQHSSALLEKGVVDVQYNGEFLVKMGEEGESVPRERRRGEGGSGRSVNRRGLLQICRRLGGMDVVDAFQG